MLEIYEKLCNEHKPDIDEYYKLLQDPLGEGLLRTEYPVNSAKPSLLVTCARVMWEKKQARRMTIEKWIPIILSTVATVVALVAIFK